MSTERPQVAQDLPAARRLMESPVVTETDQDGGVLAAYDTAGVSITLCVDGDQDAGDLHEAIAATYRAAASVLEPEYLESGGGR